jgi:biotin operon repressor
MQWKLIWYFCLSIAGNFNVKTVFLVTSCSYVGGQVFIDVTEESQFSVEEIVKRLKKNGVLVMALHKR